MKILYFGCYKPDYSRNRVLIQGLRLNGAEIVEVNDRTRSKLKYFKLFLKYLKIKKDFDLMIVGFPGQEMMFFARLLTFKPIVFDAFMSHYGGYILDRQYFSKTSLRAKYYRFVDTWSCRLANLVLLDTKAHIEFFVKEFGLPRNKFSSVLVGTDERIFFPAEVRKNNDKFLVHFHGNYIPVQGVKYIIKAAKILEDKNIEFNLIGRGQTYIEDRQLAEDLKVKNINFIDPVPYEKLPDYINQSDVCLGLLSTTLKSNLGIPNKVYEAIACRKAVITSDTDAIRELFIDRDNILLCKGADENDLANKIMELKNNNSLRERISDNGYQLFSNKLTMEKITRDLFKLLTNIR